MNRRSVNNKFGPVCFSLWAVCFLCLSPFKPGNNVRVFNKIVLQQHVACSAEVDIAVENNVHTFVDIVDNHSIIAYSCSSRYLVVIIVLFDHF